MAEPSREKNAAQHAMSWEQEPSQSVDADHDASLLEHIHKYMSAGKYSRAFALLRELLTAEPSHPEGRRLLARVLLRLGNPVAAKSAYESLIGEATSRSDYRLAESLLREYLAIGPRYVPFLEQLGRVYECLNDPLSAAIEYGRAVDVLLEDPDPDRPGHARELYEKIKALVPTGLVTSRLAPHFEPLGPPKHAPESSAATLTSQDQQNTFSSTADPAPQKEAGSALSQPDNLAISATSRPVPSIGSEADSHLEPALAESGEESPISTTSGTSTAGRLQEDVAPHAVEQVEPTSISLNQAARAPDAGTLAQPAFLNSLASGQTAEQLPSPDQASMRKYMADPRVQPERYRNRSARIAVRRVIWPYQAHWKKRIWSVSRTTMLVAALVTGPAVAAAGLAALLWTLIEQSPSRIYNELIQISPARTVQDPKRNGYFFLLGLTAPPAADPQESGYTRWRTSGSHSSDGCREPTSPPPSGFSEPVPPETQTWVQSEDPLAELLTQRTHVQEMLAHKKLLLSRYSEWLTLPFDDWGFGVSVSPDCAAVLAVHRLYLAEGFLQGMAGGVERLAADLTAWRAVLSLARTLETKAMAAEAITDDTKVLSGLLSRPDLDSRLLPHMIKLTRPLDQHERSLRWPMQHAFNRIAATIDSRLAGDPSGSDSRLKTVLGTLPLPKQRVLNSYAAYYDRTIRWANSRSGSPASLYEFARTPARTVFDSILNPIDNLLGAAMTPDWEQEMRRIMEADARLRLAGLQARLRGSSPNLNPYAVIIRAGPAFFDPFTDSPMLVNTATGRLYSVGSDGKDDGADRLRDLSVPLATTSAR